MNITPIFSKNYNKLQENYRKQRQAELEQAFHSPLYWEILQNAENRKYSGRRLRHKGLGKEIPVTLSIERKQDINPTLVYKFYDKNIEAGYVKLEELADGVYISMIKNENQNTYGGVEKLAQKIAVDNCIKRGLSKFKVIGDAMWESHVIHYLAGMRFRPMDNQYRAENLKRRFGTSNVNTIIKEILKNTPKGGKYYTSMFGCVRMYMKQDVIKNILRDLKQHPILF